MNTLKRLASQTAVYGMSSVVGRFLNYLLVPLFTYTFAPAEYGVVAELYAYMGFLAVLLTFGLETGYFRFRSKGDWAPELVYATTLRVLVLGNLAFFVGLWLFRQPIADVLRHADHPEYIWWCAAILALDSVGAVAFARLRAENRALRFALVKVAEIGANIGLNLFFIVLCRQAFEADRTAGVELVRTDPDLGAKSVLKAISEAGRCIDHDRTRINFSDKAPRIAQILGHNGIGVL